MKIGMRIPGDLRKADFAELAVWAAEMGIDAIDVPELTPEVKQTLDAAGVEVGSVDCGAVRQALSQDEAEQKAGVAGAKETISQMADLGGEVLFVALVPPKPTTPRAETFEVWKKTFPDIVAHAEDKGVKIAIEPWPGPPPAYPAIGCTPEMWRAMFAEIPSPNLGLCFDPSHLARIQIDYLRALSEFGSRVHHVHGKDCEILEDGLYLHGVLGETFGRRYQHGEGWWRYCIPGDGEIDWRRFVHRLSEFGFDGVVSIELEDHHYKGNAEAEKDGIVAAAAYLEQFVS